jgi:hypothetical protein
MISLIYVSSAVEPFTKEELLSLLETSRRNNVRINVTGMLLYKDGNFMQLIEGDAPAIHRLQARIKRDPRHTGLLTLLERPIAERQFSDWSMGFKDLSDSDLRKLPGYSAFLNEPLNSEAFAGNPSRAQKLLLTFRERM